MRLCVGAKYVYSCVHGDKILNCDVNAMYLQKGIKEPHVLFSSLPASFVSFCRVCVCVWSCDKSVYGCVGGDTAVPITSIVCNLMVLVGEQSRKGQSMKFDYLKKCRLCNMLKYSMSCIQTLTHSIRKENRGKREEA